MKYYFLLLLIVIGVKGDCQKHTENEIRRHYLFSTDNPGKEGHLDWGFHWDTVYIDQIKRHGEKPFDRKKFAVANHHPFIFLDSNGIVGVMYILDNSDSYTLLFANNDLATPLQLFLPNDDHLTIFDVAYMW